MSIDIICCNFKERCLYSANLWTGHSGFLSPCTHVFLTLNLPTKAQGATVEQTTYEDCYSVLQLFCAVFFLCCLSVCWNITKLKRKQATPPEQQFLHGELMQHNYCLLNSNHSLHPKAAPGRWVPSVQRCTGFQIGRLLTELRNMNIIDIIWIIKE